MVKEIVRYPLKIKGGSSNEFVDIKNPYGGEVIGAVAQADEQALKQAVTVAQETFHATMRHMPAHKRSEILRKTSQAIESRKEEFARTIALEGGKPIKDARVEVSRAVGTFAIASEETLRLDGEQLAMDRQPGNEGRLGLVLREPIGVVAGITPFNFPINLVAHKVAPAIAGGNAIVLKPSSQTPLSSMMLLDIMTAAGLPEGALNVVPCRGSKGQTLVTDPRLAMLTFTGSPEVGWELRKHVAPGVRLILELGGNAGIIVHDDADIEAAARAACRGGYSNAGQTCISVQRVYVQEKVYEPFINRFVQLVSALNVGNPVDETTDVGPLIDAGAAAKTIEWIDEAVKGGAKLLTGGKLQANNIVSPAVLAETKPDHKVVCQEVFGPVVAVMRYKQLDDAIAAMNDSRFGLQAGVFTANIDAAFKAARLIDVGGVMINDAPTFRADHMPYGGRKESGLGLEGVRYALHEMTQPKFVCLNMPPLKG
jgi:acyl-CoA reductase-like NAD-dependent aldehyde dehydrogenase